MTVTIEDRYYMPPEPVYRPLTETCLYEPDGADAECGEEVAHDDAILCEAHLTEFESGWISWEEYRAILAHHQIA